MPQRAPHRGARARNMNGRTDATRHVIDYCRRHDLPRLVYVSSSSVPTATEISSASPRTSPIGPQFVNDYAATKHAGERLAAAYPGEWSIVRPRAVFGPGDTVLFPRILRRYGATSAAHRQRRRAGGWRSDLYRHAVRLPHAQPRVLAPRRAFNLTNNQPVPILPFLFASSNDWGYRARHGRSAAHGDAGGARREAIHRLLRLSGEPPVTRFGVGVFAWSKTFDVSRAIAAFGPPSTSLEHGVERFVEWQRAQ